MRVDAVESALLPLLTSLLLAACQGHAHAQDPRCGDEVRSWTTTAAAELGVPLEPMACPAGVVRLRLLPADAPPIDVEVAEPPGPAFRRAGRLRVSPIVDVPDYAALPEEQRAAYEALVGWLERHERTVRFAEGPAPVVQTPVGSGLRHAGWWLVLAALALVALGWLRAPPDRVDWGIAGALFVGGAALRTGLGLWAPHHVNGQGPLWIRGALRDPALLASYGPGYPELMGPIARAAGSTPDLAVFAANATWSSLAPPLLFGIARSAGLEPRRALFAALLLLLDPVSVRTAASEAYFAPVLTLVCAATLLSMRGAARLGGRRWLAGGALMLAAGLVAAQAARVHPVAWLPLALVPAAAWLGDDARSAMARAGTVTCAAVAIAACIWLTSGGWVARVADAVLASDRGAGLLDGAGRTGLFDSGIVVLALAAAGLVVARPRAVVPVAVAPVLVALATHHVYGQSDVWQASYDRLFAPMLLVGMAALLPRGIGAATAAGMATVTVAAALVVVWPSVSRPTTEQREHRFLRAQLPAIGDDCRIAHVERAGRRVVDVPDYLAPSGRPALRVRSPDDLAAAASAGCVHWLRTSICTSEEGRSPCAEAEAAVALEPRARTVLPAHPSYDGLPYDAPQVEVAIFRAYPPRR